MSYQVLARKWRPHRFEDMVGQRHVLQALTNALDSDRLHHAYLFTGTRGVGKTTVARIFAKSLNCEKGVSASPCGECGACHEIDEGRFVDLIEVDAASRTGVDDTRELLDNVQYAPARGRYKVYLIDEVHMFSKSSFNALLKTLEEPPPHIKFLLATTDPKKIPPTILSRCLQFSLKRLTPTQIEAQLEHILKAEAIQSDPRSLEMIATAADGSLRDALSLLDQSIAFAGGDLKAEEVASMLGTIDKDQVLDLLEILIAGDAKSVLEKTEQLDQSSPDYQSILSELLSQLQALAVLQMVPDARADQRDTPRLMPMIDMISPEACQLYYQIALNGLRDLAFHPNPTAGFEMILLRMLAFKPIEAEKKKSVALESTLKPAHSRSEIAQTTRNESSFNEKHEVAPAEVEQPVPSPVTDQTSTTQSAPAEKNSTRNISITNEIEPVAEDRWHRLIREMKLNGMVYQLAISCVLEEQTEGRILLSMPKGTIHTERLKQQLEAFLQEHFKQPVHLTIEEKDLDQQETPKDRMERQAAQRLALARQVIESDPNIQTLREVFDATVIEESITPSSQNPTGENA